MTRALLALLLILGQLPAAAGARRRAVQHPVAPVASAALVAAAEQAVQAAMKVGVPAVQVAVSQRGVIVYSQAFGVTDKDTAAAATPRTVSQIASLTKQFTSAGILRLAERGALSLDDRIEKYVPEFNPHGRTITLRQLLNHTSGLRREWFPPTPPFPSLTSPVTHEQIIEGLNSGQQFDFPAGTYWAYSNAAYVLLGFAIESITGMPYADFIRTEFVLPLGLIDTGLCGTSGLPVPEGYGLTVGGWAKMEPLHATVVWSAGGLCSTATDLARWSHFLATGHVMLPDSYATMTTPNTVVPNSYALGVWSGKLLGHPVVWHGGDIYGFQSHLLYLPEQDIAIAVITNTFPGPAAASPHLVAQAIAKAVFPAATSSVEFLWSDWLQPVD